MTAGETWAKKIGGERHGCQIVVLDGKNGPHGAWRTLVDEKFPAHIFVALDNGTFEHNPREKDNDYADFYRKEERDQIRQLHEAYGVGAVVVYRTMSSNDQKLIGNIKKIKEEIPGVKIIVMGAMPHSDYYNKIPNAIDRFNEAKDKGVIYANDPDFPLVDGIDAAVVDYNQDRLLHEALIFLVPQLNAEIQ